MKVKAPEKLYVDVHDNLDDSFFYGFTKKSGDEDIEYTRTDAFIEKAVEWIKEKWDDNYTMPIIIDSVIEEFKKHMKGE